MTPQAPTPGQGVFAFVVRFLQLFVLSLALSATAHAAEPVKVSFDLPADTADKSLKRFSEQAGREVLFASAVTKDVRTNPVKGELAPREALDAMLAGTPLVVVSDDKTGSFSVRRETPEESKNGSSRPGNGDRAADGSKVEGGVIKLETFEVMGTKLLNMDVKRTTDDPQPYVILDRKQIDQSAATNLGDFLKQRVPMTSTGGTTAQSATGATGNAGSLNLRGLGTNQTLVLIDGHRPALRVSIGSPSQSNINAIPLSAVERIEILPVSAAAIYGGGATGGAINIILRHDYAGGEMRLTHENSFNTDTALDHVDFTYGINLDSHTNLMLAGSASTQHELRSQDRDYIVAGRQLLLANNGGNYVALGRPPPMGSTTNIATTDGSNLVLKNGTPLNSPITFVPVGYPGTTGDAGAALVANAGKYNINLSNTSQVSGPGGWLDIVHPAQEAALSMTLRRAWTSRFEMFVDGLASNSHSNLEESVLVSNFTLPASAPTNPFNQAIFVKVPYSTATNTRLNSTLKERRVIAGGTVKLPGNWQGEFDYTWDRFSHDFQHAPTAIAALTTAMTNGTLDPLRDTNLYPLDITPYLFPIGLLKPNINTLRDITGRASGPVVELPAGPISLSGLVEHRNESIAASEQASSATLLNYFPSESQSVDSAYMETRIPLFSKSNARPGLQEFSLQFSGRYDGYTVRGQTPSPVNLISNPTPVFTPTHNRTHAAVPLIAISYRPVQDIMLRASYSRGFLPPTVDQIASGTNINDLHNGPDPFRGNTPIGVVPTVQIGGNPHLIPEHSKSWSAGVVVEPKGLPGFRASLDWTRIDKTDNIANYSESLIVTNPTLFPGRVVRGPNLPGDQPGWLGPIIFLDTTLANIAQTKLQAYDLRLDYHHDAGSWGKFDFFLAGTYQPYLRTQALPILPVVENIGINAFNTSIPLKYRANAGITWTLNRWEGGWTAYYYDSYFIVDPTNPNNATLLKNQGNGGRIPAQVYHDMFVAYKFPRGGRVWEYGGDLELKLGVKNVFNKEPPLDITNPNPSYSQLADPRKAVYYITLRKSFGGPIH